MLNNISKMPYLDFINKPINCDGVEFLSDIPDCVIKSVWFDPQYRGVLDKQKYGNEGKNRGVLRCSLPQMDNHTITDFLFQINRVLLPSGHLFLWVDKFHLCEGTKDWFSNTELQIVDLVVWEKSRIGMGYRTRNKCEFLLILQKKPIRAKGIWTIHNIPNVWKESIVNKIHPHQKPLELQQKLIEATNKKGDIVLDPAMGSGSVFEACKNLEIDFLGCDVEYYK